jgi:hypothetical protein
VSLSRIPLQFPSTNDQLVTKTKKYCHQRRLSILLVTEKDSRQKGKGCCPVWTERRTASWGDGVCFAKQIQLSDRAGSLFLSRFDFFWVCFFRFFTKKKQGRARVSSQKAIGRGLKKIQVCDEKRSSQKTTARGTGCNKIRHGSRKLPYPKQKNIPRGRGRAEDQGLEGYRDVLMIFRPYTFPTP